MCKENIKLGTKMEEASFTPLRNSIPGRGRILTAVFKSGSKKVKKCGVFSKFLAAGFEVLHVGINVHTPVFIRQMKRFSPHVIILFCQGNISGIKELIEAIKGEGMRSMVRVIVYGSSIRESVRDEVHADACAENEQELLDMVNEIVNETFL